MIYCCIIEHAGGGRTRLRVIYSGTTTANSHRRFFITTGRGTILLSVCFSEPTRKVVVLTGGELNFETGFATGYLRRQISCAFGEPSRIIR